MSIPLLDLLPLLLAALQLAALLLAGLLRLLERTLLLPPRRVQLRLSSRVSEALMRCPTQKSALL